MATRHELRLALAALLTVAASGCAGGSFTMPWSKSAKADAPKTFEDLATQHTPQNRPNAFTSGLKKTTSSITDALTIKPKVIPAKDPTSLNSEPPKIGADLYVRAARIHESRGNFDAAAEEYDKAIKADPKDLSALVGYARLHDRRQNFVEAERLYHEASKIEGLEHSSGTTWDFVTRGQKKHQQAVSSIEKAIQLQPQNQMYRNNIATVLVEVGQVDQAWTHLTAANPPAVAHYNMAYLLHKQGQPGLAKQHLQHALAADPSLTAAEQLLASLQDQPGDYGSAYVSAPQTSSTYSISDQDEAATGYAPPVERSDAYMARSEGSELVNPLAPSTRRSPSYRMPPIEEQASDPAPRPERLPAVSEEPQQSQPTLELGNPAAYGARRISHETEEGEIQQPKNVIRLLGGEPLTAPIPGE